jgi:protein-disulfide isomerase
LVLTYPPSGTEHVEFVVHTELVAGWLMLLRTALHAAEAAECAREQGRFWEMHDALFANQKSLARADLLKYAVAAHIDTDKLSSCIDDGRAKARIEADLAEAARLNLTGTPSFFLGERVGDRAVRVHYRIVGAHPFSVFQEAIAGASARRRNALTQ